MVVLRMGGVYADVDVECRQPLDHVIQPTDTMVVGWEGEVPTHADANSRNFARRRQLLQWFFAAAPGHPALRKLCDHIARNAMNTFSANPIRDTLERTGPAVFTDMVLEHALSHPIAKVKVGQSSSRSKEGGNISGCKQAIPHVDSICGHISIGSPEEVLLPC